MYPLESARNLRKRREGILSLRHGPVPNDVALYTPFPMTKEMLRPSSTIRRPTQPRRGCCGVPRPEITVCASSSGVGQVGLRSGVLHVPPWRRWTCSAQPKARAFQGKLCSRRGAASMPLDLWRSMIDFAPNSKPLRIGPTIGTNCLFPC